MKREYVFLSVIAAAALLLRLYALGEYSFWYDESLHILSAKYMLFDLTGRSWVSNFPPLFDLFLKIWLKLGSSEFILRLPSLLFSMAALPLTFALGKLFFDAKTGIAAALITAFMPFQIYYAQDLGPYSLYQFLCLLSLYLLASGIERGKKISPVYLVAFVNLVALYTHYFTAFLVLAETMYLLLLRPWNRRLLIHWFLAHLAVLALFLPHFNVAWQTFSRYRQPMFGYGLALTPQNIFSIFSNFFFGYHGIKQFVYAGSGIFLVYLLFSAARIKQQGIRIFFVIIIVFPFLASWLIFREHKVLMPRYFLWVSPFVYILLASFLAKGRFLAARVILAAVFFAGWAICIPRYYTNSVIAENELRHGNFPKIKIKDSIKLIEQSLGPEDAIVHAHMFTHQPFQVYRGKIEPRDFRVYLSQDTIWNGDLGGYFDRAGKMPPALYDIQDSFIPRDIAVLRGRYKRIWFVVLPDENELYKAGLREKMSWLENDDDLKLSGVFQEDSLKLFLFERITE